MPAYTLNIDPELLTAATLDVHEEWIDGDHIKTAYLDAQDDALGKGKPGRPGGPRWIFGVAAGDHSSTTEHTSGYEEISMDAQSIGNPMVYKPAFATRSVMISFVEQELNGASETQIVDIAETRLKKELNAMRRELNQQLVQGGVAGWSQWYTLNGEDYDTGFLERGGIGAGTNTIGELDRSSFAGTPGLHNVATDMQDSFNTDGLSGLHDLEVELGIYGDAKKRRILASRAAFKNYKRVVQAYERYVDKSQLDAGNLSLAYAGTSLEPEYYMANAGATTSTYPISFMFLDFEDIHVIWSDVGQQGYFGLDEWDYVGKNFKVLACVITCKGQLVARGRTNSCGLAVRGDTF